MNDYVAGLRFRSDSREVERSEKDLKGLERQSGRTEKAAASLGKALGRAFAGISVGVVARRVIQNTIEQEKATAQLHATLQSTGRYTPTLSKNLHEYASALQQVTTFGDEAILTAQSQLLTFTEIGEKTFPRATMAALDLATKMDTDLKSAVIQVGKALNDPAKGLDALNRSGIQFSDTQRDLVKELVSTNRKAEAQEIILKELETQFGGSAEAARDTFGGALQGVKNAIGDLLEADGDSLPSLISNLNQLEKTLQSPSIKHGMQNLTQGILNASMGGATILSEFGNLGDQMAANFAAATGNLSLEDEIQQELNAVERALNNGFFGRPLKFLTTSREELERIRAGLLSLQQEASVIEFGIAPGSDTPSGPDFSGLDGDPLAPIVVNAEKREKELAAIKRRIARDLQQLAREAGEGLQGILDDQAATLGGPLVQAAQHYNETLAMLADQERAFANAGTLSAERQRELNLARERAVQVLNQETEAIYEEERALAALLTPTEQFIDDLQFELSLMGLGNREREKEIALRYAGAEATEAQRRAISEMIGELQRQSETAANLDQFRSAFSRAFGDAVRDIENAGDAIERLGDRILDIVLQNLGDQLVESLFGAFGSAQVGGSAGENGFWSSLITGLFSSYGGGRAQGGPVSRGMIYEVNERGPELLNMGGKQYLMANQNGHVTPTSKTFNTNKSTIVVNLPPESSRRSANALASAMLRESTRQSARNR